MIQFAADIVFSMSSIIFFQSLFTSMGTDANFFSSTLPMQIGSIIGSIVWTIYLFKSARVKTTFIYAHQYPEAFQDDGYTYSAR